MKKLLLLLMTAGIGLTAMAQGGQCLGLKNPTNFALYNNPLTGRYQGYTGTKAERASTCTLFGSNFPEAPNVSAGNLASISDGSSCTSSNPASVDQNNQGDQMKRFVIKAAGTDPYTVSNAGGLPYMPPDSTFTRSIRLGNYCGGTGAEMITYETEIGVNNGLITLWYAMSLENALHDAANNPEFALKVQRLNDINNTWENIGNAYCYVQPSPTNSQNLSPFLAGGTGNVFLPWQKVVISLYPACAGQKIRIMMATGDCSYSAHYGASFIAGECSPMKLTASGCAAGANNNVTEIHAPKGVLEYRWYRSPSGVIQSQNPADYILIPRSAEQRRGDSVFTVLADYFVVEDGSTVAEQTFLCELRSTMNFVDTISSVLTTTVTNKKPAIMLNEQVFCDGSVILRDKSRSPAWSPGSDPNLVVDSNHSVWNYYSGPTPSEETLLFTETGYESHYTFETPGEHSITLRAQLSNEDTSCWNEKTFTIRSLATPETHYNMSDSNLCSGDTIMITDNTPNILWREWIVHHDNGTSDTLSVSGAALYRPYDSTEVVELRNRNNYSYTVLNVAGTADSTVYCENTYSKTILVEQYPTIRILGDSIVCRGSRSNVEATSNVPNSTYDWYQSYNGALLQNGAILNQEPTSEDGTVYFTRAESPFGCVSWGNVRIALINPKVTVPNNRMCTGEYVDLFATGANEFTWTASPADPSLYGQENAEQIHVSPQQTTVYSMVGHAQTSEGTCNASPVTNTITVYPIPVPTFEMSPGFIDSEDPTVTFRDVSPYSTSSIWDFGGGNTSTASQVNHYFTSIKEDSVQVGLTTANALGCAHDTSFWVRIEMFSVWFPNAFTPNLYGNKVFKLETNNELEYFSIYIYDRRGDLVFSSEDQNFEWDGTHNGAQCQQGSYVYICNYRRPGLNTVISRKGTVTLLL